MSLVERAVPTWQLGERSCLAERFPPARPGLFQDGEKPFNGLAPDNPLLNHPRVLCTPHLGDVGKNGYGGLGGAWRVVRVELGAPVFGGLGDGCQERKGGQKRIHLNNPILSIQTDSE